MKPRVASRQRSSRNGSCLDWNLTVSFGGQIRDRAKGERKKKIQRGGDGRIEATRVSMYVCLHATDITWMLASMSRSLLPLPIFWSLWLVKSTAELVLLPACSSSWSSVFQWPCSAFTGRFKGPLQGSSSITNNGNVTHNTTSDCTESNNLNNACNTLIDF